MRSTGVVSRLITCLNPYVACRKDAVGVSNVTMQSSIVTGSEIGPPVTALSLIKESVNSAPRSYNQRPNGRY